MRPNRFILAIAVAALLAAGLLAYRVRELTGQVGSLEADRSRLTDRVAELETERTLLARKLDAAVYDLGELIKAQPAAPPELETGVIESDEPFPTITTGMEIQNRWQGETGDGDFVMVFAGAAGGSGLLLVVEQTRDAAGGLMIGQVERYPAPGAHGAVRIVGETGQRLTLRAADGTSLYFDLPSRSYVDGA